MRVLVPVLLVGAVGPAFNSVLDRDRHVANQLGNAYTDQRRTHGLAVHHDGQPSSTLFLRRNGLDGRAHLIMRLEVLDADDGLPVRDAEISFADHEDRRIAILNPDEEGLVIIAFSTSSDLSLYTPFSITARAPRRLQWRQTMSERQLLDESHKVALWIRRENVHSLTDGLIVEAIKRRRYSHYRTAGVPLTVDEYVFSRTPGGFFVWNGTIQMGRLGGSRGNPQPGRVTPGNRVARGEPEPTTITLRVGPTAIDVHPTNLPPSHWYAATHACSQLSSHGYNDWVLPSIEELEALSESRDSIPDLTDDSTYWSATETKSGSYAWALSLGGTRASALRVSVRKGTTYDVRNGTLQARCIRRHR